MAKVKPLPAKALCKRCNPNQFSFKTTTELEDFDDIIGQKRAVEAIEFGIGIRHKGYNLFVLGPPGTGRHGVIRRFVERQALEEEIPSDWCYVNNFSEAHEPRAIELPPGKGAPFQKDMERLLALGLATGIIGMVINIVGSLVNGMIPYVGWILMILVLIGGHLFNLVISLVGAFIHSGRLQYVEFFKRFFNGGGKEFSPFVRQSKYINLIK